MNQLEEKREYHRKYYLRNRDEALQTANEYRKTHKDEIKSRNKDQYLKNREKRLEEARIYRLFNREKINEKEKEYYRKNKEKINLYHQQYRKLHMDEIKIRARNRYLKKKGSGGRHTFAEWEAVLVAYDHKCFYCGRGDKQLEKDHDVPIVRGGSDNIENILPACHSCNASKGTKTATEFWRIVKKHWNEENAGSFKAPRMT